MNEQTQRRQNYPAGEWDALKWAEEFVRIAQENPAIATDEGTMLGWFANAIMTGYHHAIFHPPNRFGVPVEDGGEMGTIVRCHECGGSGELHRPDTMPPLEGASDDIVDARPPTKRHVDAAVDALAAHGIPMMEREEIARDVLDAAWRAAPWLDAEGTGGFTEEEIRRVQEAVDTAREWWARWGEPLLWVVENTPTELEEMGTEDHDG